jgi:predicted nucleic acid-binding protein
LSPHAPLSKSECPSSSSRLWDADTGLKWAELLARLRKNGKTMPIKDSLIAATAVVHDLAVATRNRIDFAKAGVEVVDPFFG